MISRREIAEQDSYLLKRQREFRQAADIVTDAWMKFDEILAIALIGSVAKPLWKEVPRFSEYRRAGIEVWHECGDIDLAVWIERQTRLGALRRTAELALRDAFTAGTGISVVGHQLDIFLIEPETDRYLGRLCKFSQCPKVKPECRTPGCGAIPFNKVVPAFEPQADLLAPASYAMLYRRGQGRLRSALDLPSVTQPAD